ncbi:hypothetical protein REPUB_Repub11eG0060500 [Reevesia pubescens]
MASFNVYSILVILFITSAVVLGTELDDVDDIIKKNNCDAKISMNCGFELFYSIFSGGDVTNKCCSELKVFGKVCHNAYVKRTILLIPEGDGYVFGAHWDDIIKEMQIRSIQIWNNCESISPSP